MKNKKKWYHYEINRSIALVLFVAVILMFTLRMEKIELYLPGGVKEINSIVEIENETESDGRYYSSYVTTITKPTPIIYFFAINFMHAEVVELSVVEQKMTDKQMTQISRVSKTRSIDAAIYSAYREADKLIEYHNIGVIIPYIDPNSFAYLHLEIGDIIKTVNGETIIDADSYEDIFSKVTKCDEGLKLTVLRDGKEVFIETPLSTKENGKCYLGVSYADQYEFTNAYPEFQVVNNSGLGGSAGLLQALMIYDKLIDNDITYGKKISGTGGINFEGKVTSIAGIKQKVLGAIKDDMDIFFAPDLGTGENNLAKIAQLVVEEENADLIIVPVKTLKDAINYLKTTYGLIEEETYANLYYNHRGINFN